MDFEKNQMRALMKCACGLSKARENNDVDEAREWLFEVEAIALHPESPACAKLCALLLEGKAVAA